MTVPGGKPPKNPKGFLGDDDMLSELDAWDATFDALHGPDGGDPPTAPVMDWPPAAEPLKPTVDPTVVSRAAPSDESATFDDFELSSDLEAQLTLDNALEEDSASDHEDGLLTTTADRLAIDLGETDFSDVGAKAPPAALSDLLGRSPSRAPGSATRPPDVDSEPDADEDAIYTSAARSPAVPVSARPAAPIVPPPVAERRTPAIVRRVAPQPIPNPRQAEPSADDDLDDSFGNQTRIIASDEIEIHASASRSMQAVAPPPAVEEDAYDDIEIEAAEPPGAAASASEPPAQRRTAHLVRRADTQSRPPLIRPGSSGPIIEINADESDPELAIGVEQPEYDFSDVAASVGAADSDLELLVDLRVTGERPEPDLTLDEVEEIRIELSAPASELDGLEDFSDFQDAGSSAVELTIPGERGLPLQLDGSIEPEDSGSIRPSALVELYPRVKTPTSVPPIRPRSVRLQTPMPVEVATVNEIEPTLDLDSAGRAWPVQLAPLASVVLDEASAQALLVYEREVTTLDDSATSAALRIEAGRLCERLSDGERARVHYDAALLADPRATTALRGLRRIARAAGDLEEATRHLDTEIAVAGALERRPLSHYRVDLLMASGEQDLARVAAGEILDSAPSDIRALLAQLELAFLDGRADEFGVALEQIAHAVSDNELRAAVQAVRGTLAAHHNDTAAAASWFVAAAQADPSAIAAQLGAVRHAAAQADGDAASRALLEVARQIEASDPITAAAAAVRAQQWSRAASGVMPKDRAAVAAAAAALATASAPSDPLVARLAAETAAAGGDPTVTGAAFAHWAACARAPAERAYAAARAAELDPAHASELWASVISLDPGDDYAAAQLRTAHVTSEATQAAIDVDLATAEDVERDRARLRAAYGLIAQGQLDAAIDVLTKGRAARPVSVAIGEALGEALAAAGKWTERAQLFAELARQPGEQLDGEVAQLRSAIAWEEAVGAAAALEGSEAPSLDDLQRITAQALEAWERVLELSPGNPTGQAAALVLANRLGDGEVIAEALARAQAAERTPLAAASLAFRRIRLVADDLARSDALLRDIHPLDDPRRTVALVIAAARAGELGEAAAALEERANHLDARTAATEIAALRLRAAQLALDANDAPRAMRLLQQVEAALPNLRVVRDLLAAASRRAGDRPAAPPVRRSEPAIGASSADAFVRAVRDADLSLAHGDAAAALALYQRALEINPGDPLAIVPLVRIATELREPTAITGLALAQLRAAQDAGDHVAKAVAYELLAQIDSDLRNDPGSSQIALESASQADPSRIDLMHRLERGYAADDEIAELLRLRKAELETLPAELSRDRVALQLDIAGLATRDGRTEIELAEMYRGVLKTDPAARLALLHLEAIVRRSGFSDELADVEDKIASYFEGDPKTQAAFWTRAGETLADIGQIDAAVQRFGRAEAAFPGHLPALEGWRQAALKGGLWIDVAEAAARQALNAPDLATQAALHHFAGVALMDKALVGEQAMAAFRRALEANPGHKDAFLRLRILLEEDANHDDLASLLALRLDVETDPAAQVELHRALAELHRNFLSDRETATKHFRAILEAEPNDLRSHAAIADIAWEQGNWQEAADALMARARLERQPDVLKTLCFRLGLIYADRLVDGPMAIKAFQRALTYQPDDENTLTRLADIAAQIGEWKLALGACERLVKNESDPDRRVAHLHRVARIFKDGFGDRKRSERALNLALDSAPTNDQALQELVQFYKDVSDLTSVRVHLNRVAGAMRARVAQVPLEGVPYRVIARAMAARANTNVAGSLPIARAAAQLADLLGAAGAPEQALINEPAQPDLSQLMRPESDEVLFPRGVQPELRQMFQLLGDRIAKHVGVNIQSYGVSRGDRARGRDNPVAAVAQSVATALGYPEIDVYVTTRQPWVMIAEPTSPVSLILGSSIAAMGGDAIRFAAGGALKLAQASMAIPVRLPVEELGVLVVALLRLFQPEFPILAVDAELVAVQHQKLRRLIPTNLMNELRPFALAVDPARFDHRELSRDLKIAGWRAGLVASGSLLAGLRILAAQAEGELPGFLADPLAQGLVAFALSEDHATVAR
ncbi:MAG: Tetratricopeptide repeat protein [Deltaproteobacteria bacterium]|nr:Tetratricopeptide repeat protein [Deltaproteobacteria bacterium]